MQQHYYLTMGSFHLHVEYKPRPYLLNYRRYTRIHNLFQLMQKYHLMYNFDYHYFDHMNTLLEYKKYSAST